jgi:hypothetical protein
MNSATTFDVDTQQALNQAIARADAATSGVLDILFTTSTIVEGTDVGATIDFGENRCRRRLTCNGINLHAACR